MDYQNLVEKFLMTEHDTDPKEKKLKLPEEKVKFWFFILVSAISTVVFFKVFTDDQSSSIAEKLWSSLTGACVYVCSVIWLE